MPKKERFMNKTKFDIYFDRLIGHEGGYVNDPYDPGGETNWGITKRVATEFGYIGPMSAMKRKQARVLYRKFFWEKYKMDIFPKCLAFQLFDACVNHGHENMIRMLQRAVDVVDDGLWGKHSQQALMQIPMEDVVMLFISERLRFFTKLKKFDKYGRGWTRRVATDLRYAASDN